MLTTFGNIVGLKLYIVLIHIYVYVYVYNSFRSVLSEVHLNGEETLMTLDLEAHSHLWLLSDLTPPSSCLSCYFSPEAPFSLAERQSLPELHEYRDMPSMRLTRVQLL